jgi:hypothetical protein
VDGEKGGEEEEGVNGKVTAGNGLARVGGEEAVAVVAVHLEGGREGGRT